MAYRLDFGQDVPVELRRLLVELAESAAQRLQEAESDPVEAVHRARTDLKRARAALRLAEPGMPSKAYREADHALRDRGRALAASRDADVALATLEGLAERFVGRVPAADFDALREPLRARAAAERRGGVSLGEQAIELRAVAAAVPEWPLADCDLRVIARGLTESYARGRRALADVHAEPAPERLHEWRKRVKDHWYQLRLMRDAWRQVIGAHAHQARALSRLLGEDHDLAAFGDLVASDASLASVPADTETLLELVAARRAAVRHDAVALGERLYAEKPKALRRRLGRYVRAAAQNAG